MPARVRILAPARTMPMARLTPPGQLATRIPAKGPFAQPRDVVAPNWAVRADGSQRSPSASATGGPGRLTTRCRVPRLSRRGALRVVTASNMMPSHHDGPTRPTATPPRPRSAFVDVGPVRWPAPDLSLPPAPVHGWSKWWTLDRVAATVLCSPCCLGCLIAPAWADQRGPVSRRPGSSPGSGPRGVSVWPRWCGVQVLGAGRVRGQYAGGGIGHQSEFTDRIIYVTTVASGPVMF